MSTPVRSPLPRRWPQLQQEYKGFQLSLALNRALIRKLQAIATYRPELLSEALYTRLVRTLGRLERLKIVKVRKGITKAKYDFQST